MVEQCRTLLHENLPVANGYKNIERSCEYVSEGLMCVQIVTKTYKISEIADLYNVHYNIGIDDIYTNNNHNNHSCAISKMLLFVVF